MKSAPSIFLSFLLLASLARFAEAQEPRSVYSVDPTWDGAIVLSTALGSLYPYVNAQNLIRPRCPCDPAEVNSLDRGAIGNSNAFLGAVSDVTVGLAFAAPIAADYLDQGASSAFLEDLTVYLEALSINGALVTFAKYTTQRPLPRVYAGLAPELLNEPGGYRSFYSGHTSVAVASLAAAAFTLNLRHPMGVWPWLVTAGLGVSVAAERVADGRHFYTDVALGAVMGAAVGILVPYLHERNRGSKTSVTLAPVSEGLQLTWARRF